MADYPLGTKENPRTLNDILKPLEGPLNPDGHYQIELHQESLLGGTAAHNYWLLRDTDSGSVVATLNGYASDPKDPNLTNKTVGQSGDKLFVRTDQTPSDFKTSKPILTFGADFPAKDIEARWNAAVEAGREFNKKSIDYEMFGGTSGRVNDYDADGIFTGSRIVHQGNSNSAARAIGTALAVPLDQMEHAIGDGKKSPGFGRDLYGVFPDIRRPTWPEGKVPDQTDVPSSDEPPGSGGGDQSRLDDQSNDELRSRFAAKLMIPGDPSEDILLKPPREWTEPEMREVLASPIYRRYDDPLGAFANDQVRAWHESAYGTAEMKARGLAPLPPPERAITRDDRANNMDAIAAYLAERAGVRGETGAVQDWQAGLNGLERRGPDGTPFFLLPLAVDGNLGARTRFATRQAVSALGAQRLLNLFD